MSVVGYEIEEEVVEKPQAVWFCWSCVKQLALSMNIGQPEAGLCDRCGFHTMRYKESTSEVN